MAEKRLIDAKPLMENGWHLVKTGESNRFLTSMSLADVPTVDAVEIEKAIEAWNKRTERPKGRWIVDDYDSGDPGYYAAFIEVHCSECGYELGAESGQYGWLYGDPFPLTFCPNCGDDMRGESE